MTIPTRTFGANSKFSARAGIVTLASTLVLTGVIASQRALAQDSDGEAVEPVTEEILVTGIRQSLMNAQDMKRQESTFVDAISAADIGALPDRSVLEALQRLPGVSVERFASSSDPDRFSSEGSGAVVRGMTATRTEFNGRDSFTASSGRGLSFQDISPELMSSVKLYKNQTADMIEGGIGGTVSMYTRKPFEQPGRLVAFSADYTYFDLSKERSPSISGLFSDRWDTDIGEFGMLVSLAKGESMGQSDGIQSTYFNTNSNTDGTFNSPLDAVRYPSGSNLSTKLDERERRGAAVSLQFQNTDETFLATFDWIRSDSSLKWQEQRVNLGNWDTSGGRYTRSAEGTQWNFDDTGTFTDGVLAHGVEGWRSSRWSAPTTPGTLGSGYDNFRVPDGPGSPDECFIEAPIGTDCNRRSKTFGKSGSTTARIQDSNTLVDDYSFNFKFNPSDKWEIVADFQFIDAQSSNTDMEIGTGFWGLNYFDTTGDVPTMALLNPWDVVSAGTIDELARLEAQEIALGGNTHAINRNGNDYFAQPSSYWWNNASDTYMRATGDETAIRLDSTYFIENNFFTAVKMGVRMSERQQEVRDVRYSNWGSISPQRDPRRENGESGHGAAWLDMHNRPGYEVVDWSNFFRGEGAYMGAGRLDGSTINLTEDDAQFLMVHPSMGLIRRYQQWDGLLTDVIDSGNADHWVPAQMRDTNNDGIVDTQGYFLPEELSDIKEVNQAAYVRVDFGSDDYRFKFDGNIGVRYYQVELESSGYVRFADLRSTETDPADTDYYSHANNYLSPTETGFGNAATELTFAENDYSHWLPSVNLKVEFTEDLLGRFAISKAVSLPDIGDLRSYVDIGAILSQAEYYPTDPMDTLQAREIVPGTVEVLQWTASGGNPFLVPMESTQYDASLEWYFADVGSLTASVFYKDLKNFFVDGAFARPITNPITGVTQDVMVSGKVNAGEGSLQGFEIAYQQYFDMLPSPWDGLGMQINYTFIDVNGVPNPALEGAADQRSDAVKQDLPLQSQSEDTANFALMYEKYDFEFRAAYNWRSEYLVTARDGTNLPFPPTWAAAEGYLDASLFYNVNDNIKVGFQGNNLTDSISETEYQSVTGLERNGRSWFMNDRRYTFVVRAKF